MNIDLENISKLIDETNIYTQHTVDTIISKVHKIMYTAATKCKPNVNNKTISTTIYEPELRSCSDISRDISIAEIKKWNDILTSKDTKNLWKEIGWNKNNNYNNNEYPPIEKLANHFKNKSIITEIEYFNPHQDFAYVDILDKPITENEISEASQKLKDGKSSADGWTPKMITAVSGTLFPILFVLFNVIFQYALYPSKWCTTMISAIFKNKGSKSDATNYRPISLVDLLSKLLDFFLLKRFRNWFIAHELQTAYQTGKSCSDHVFLLRTLISHCKRKHQKLFIICIDFEGAFDKVSRHILFKKLKLFGAGGIFILCLMSIYQITDCVIFQGETSFSYHLLAGIKQGLPLSPWLFLFYVNDIFDYFDAIYGHDHVLEALHILIHADDTTILANSRASAEQKVKSLLNYCTLNAISLQISKCEFIAINGDRNDQIDIQIPKGKIRNVKHVKLLGSHFSQSGRIMDDLELHMNKRCVSVHQFYNWIRSNKLAPIPVKLKVMQACVSTSLLYNCETFADKLPENIEKPIYQ